MSDLPRSGGYRTRQLTSEEVLKNDNKGDWEIVYWFGGNWRTVICSYEIAVMAERMYETGRASKVIEIKRALGIP